MVVFGIVADKFDPFKSLAVGNILGALGLLIIGPIPIFNIEKDSVRAW